MSNYRNSAGVHSAVLGHIQQAEYSYCGHTKCYNFIHGPAAA